MRILLPILLAACIFTACNNNSPVGVTTEFLDCLVLKDFDCAKRHCTASGVMAISFIESVGKSEFAFTGYKITRDSVEGDKAWVYYDAEANGQKRGNLVELTKIDGKWKVDPSMRK